MKNLYITGTADAILSSPTLVDYKTTGRKPSKMNDAHYIQALLYTKMARSKGYSVNQIDIVYIVRKTKTMEPRVFVLSRKIEEYHMKWLDRELEILSDKLDITKDDPKMIQYLFHYNVLDQFEDSIFEPDPEREREAKQKAELEAI